MSSTDVPGLVAPGPAGTGFTIHHFPTITSTNSYLASLAAAGAPGGIVAVAAHQSAGRGRLQRRWEAPAGASLLLSVLMRPRLAPRELHLCTAVVALATAAACHRLCAVDADVKWPNDLVVGTRKLAGVLAESVSGAVVVGVGCNVAWPPPLPMAARDAGDPEVLAQATSLAQLVPAPPTVDQLCQAVLEELAPRLADLDDELGRRRQAACYRSACATVGRRVRVQLPGEVFTGAAVDVTAEGQLVVDTPVGRRIVSAGDVVHLRSGT